MNHTHDTDARDARNKHIDVSNDGSEREVVTPLHTAASDPLLDGLLLLCRLFDRPASANALTAGLPLAGGRMTPELLGRAARRADLEVTVKRRAIASIAPESLPVLLIRKDGSAWVLTEIGRGGVATVIVPEIQTRPQHVSLADLQAQHSGQVAFAGPLVREDARAGSFAAPSSAHWFWGDVTAYKGAFLEVAFAAAMANLLAVATSIFSMQIYDRVIPNLAFPTLWVLAIGAGLAIGLEALIRQVRSRLMDHVGRKLDLQISSRIFEKALGLRLDVRPKSTGSFTNQVREFDAVREFFTSTTISALSDLPFVVLFIGIIGIIGGWPVALVVFAAVPLIVIPGLIAQARLSELSRQHLREGSVRNGLLIEAMAGAETVKALRGEGRFQRLWEEYSALIAGNGLKLRSLSGSLGQIATSVQQIAYIMVIITGVYQISNGEMTQGALIACSILTSRAISPLTQLAAIFARWQQMKASLQSIDAIMEAPQDRPTGRQFVHRPRLSGAYAFDQVAFGYEKDGPPALRISKFMLSPGSTTALLGANGSGKSTLLKLLAGLYEPAQGRILMDGVDLRQIDPADVRKGIGYLPQDTGLFYGTLRENLTLGLRSVDDELLLDALAFAGAETLVSGHPLGLDRMLGEGGNGVSGGQRQSIAMGRLWLRDPAIVLMDEPTAAMDHVLELQLIERIRLWAEGRTLVIATHRLPVLSIVKNALVIANGQVVTEGPRDEVLAKLSPNRGSTP